MFATSDVNEETFSSAFAPPGVKCWRAVNLVVARPIFVPTWYASEHGLSFSEHALLLRQEDLLQLIEEVGAGSLVNLQYLVPADKNKRWEIRDIRKVWSCSRDEIAGGPVVVMEDQRGLRFTHIECEIPDRLDREIWLARPQGMPIRKAKRSTQLRGGRNH
ncbi:hypothetical protein [Variovorax rhizosphaerae]|uniref:Uncharacterized protein n=1 Tax=Variovorax rhizosphaerae TaxID=1836200 RepID=A0ABU8WTX3_9BURK